MKGVLLMNENKTTNAERVKKCLKENYRQLRVNVRSDKLDVWKQYAASKGTSLYALVNQFFDEAIEKDGFIPPPSTFNVQPSTFNLQHSLSVQNYVHYFLQ